MLIIPSFHPPFQLLSLSFSTTYSSMTFYIIFFFSFSSKPSSYPSITFYFISLNLLPHLLYYYLFFFFVLLIFQTFFLSFYYFLFYFDKASFTPLISSSLLLCPSPRLFFLSFFCLLFHNLHFLLCIISSFSSKHSFYLSILSYSISQQLLPHLL